MRNDTLYHKILEIESYAEFMLKCTIFNIFIPPTFDESRFNWYIQDDWRWHCLAESIADGFTIPF